MRRICGTLLAGTLAAVLGACSGDDPGDPSAASADASSPTPRVQIGTWTAVAGLPQPRSELSATVLDGLVYVAGGVTQGPGAAALLRYDPASDTWRELAPLPDRRNHAPLAAYDGRVYMVAGYGYAPNADYQPFPSYASTTTLFVYDVADDAWRVGPSLPVPVGAHAVATTDDGMIHVLGGIGEEPFTARDDHLVFDTTAGTWSTLPPMPTGRESLGAAYLDGVIYAAAGRFGGEGVAFEAYDVESQEWTSLPDVPTSRSGVAVVAFQGQIYVLGGETVPYRTYDHAERFDPTSGTWQEVTPMPSARHGLGGVALDDGIMVIAGGPESGGALGSSHTADTEIWRP